MPIAIIIIIVIIITIIIIIIIVLVRIALCTACRVAQHFLCPPPATSCWVYKGSTTNPWLLLNKHASRQGILSVVEAHPLEQGLESRGQNCGCNVVLRNMLVMIAAFMVQGAVCRKRLALVTVQGLNKWSVGPQIPLMLGQSPTQ